MSWSGSLTLESCGLRLSQPASTWCEDLSQDRLEFFSENCRGFTFQGKHKEALGRMVPESWDELLSCARSSSQL